MMGFMRLVVGFIGMALLAASSAAAQTSDIGIVVLHGTQGNPDSDTIRFFVSDLERAGYRTQVPVMCWSANRIFDKTYLDCLKEIDGAIAALRAAGARRIAVAGHSRGGSAAIVYAIQHPDLAGVISLAPSANPEQYIRNPDIADSIAKAQQMVDDGNADGRASFADFNNGRPFTVNTTAATYLSFHQPGGPADYPERLPQLHVPIIWIAGIHDPLQDQSAEFFQRIPANPLNQYVKVDADHRGTPRAGTEAVLAWLAHLPAK